MSKCPFKYADTLCIHGKRYRHVEPMPDKLLVRKLRRELGVDREPDVQCDQWLVWWHEPKLADDRPEDGLMFVGQCFACDKVSRQDTPSWREEIRYWSKYWSK